MEKMKRIALLAGMLATTLFFSIGVSLASDGSRKADPPKDGTRGHFGFLSRPAPPIPPHYFRINVATDFTIIGSNSETHSAGVNVYWKTTGSDQERGRTRVSPIAANLPDCPFSQRSPCRNVNSKRLDGSSEHLEGLMWAAYPGEPDMDKSGNGGSPDGLHDHDCYDPDSRLGQGDIIHRRTRFFWGFYYGNKVCGNGIADNILVDNKGNIVGDPNVQLSAMFNTQSSTICNNAGSRFCGGSDMISNGDIYIPSNNLEYMVIEVIGFKTRSGGGDYFYNYPIVALKYTRVNPGNPNDYRMVFHHSSLDPLPSFFEGFYKKGFSSWDNINISNSNLHYTMADPNEKVEYEVGTGKGVILNFENIDYLGINLKFMGRFDGFRGNNAKGGGVGVEINKYNLTCPLDSIECLYPTRY